MSSKNPFAILSEVNTAVEAPSATAAAATAPSSLKPKHHGPKRGQRGWRGGRGREFDRHSGMHRDSERKQNAGWGNPTDDSAVVENEEDIVKEEEEVPVKTLDEYLAEKASTLSVKKEVRKVEPIKEGVVKKKEDEDEDFISTERKVKEKKEKAAKKQVVEDIVFKFNEAERGRGGRGGSGFRGGRGRGDGSRGGPRGGRGGRGSGRGGRGGERGGKRVNLNDSNAFPVLA